MIRIYDLNLNCIGLIEEFNSFQYSLCYQKAGTFALKAMLTPKIEKLLVAGNIVSYDDFTGIIDSIQKTEAVGEVATIIASGFDLTGLLMKRIIWNNESFEGNCEEYCRKIVSENAIAPTDANRIIPFLTLGNLNGLTAQTNRKSDNETLYQMIMNVCVIADYGFRIRFSPRDRQFIFDVYQGENKTVGTPHQVILGKNYGNVAKQDYAFSSRETITTVLVKADGYSTSLGTDASGFDRNEKYVYSGLTKTNDMTDKKFQNAVISEGEDALTENVECFDIDVFNVSLSIGDMVNIKDKSWNLQSELRITEKQIAIQNGITTTTYLLGNDIMYL